MPGTTRPRLSAHDYSSSSSATLRHWSLSDPYIREVTEHREVERPEMYGESDETVARGLQPVTTDGVAWSTVPRRIGFLRTPEGGQRRSRPSEGLENNTISDGRNEHDDNH